MGSKGWREVLHKCQMGLLGVGGCRGGWWRVGGWYGVEGGVLRQVKQMREKRNRRNQKLNWKKEDCHCGRVGWSNSKILFRKVSNNTLWGI